MNAVLDNCLAWVGLDTGYGRNRAGTLEGQEPVMYAGLLRAFDTELAARGISRPKPFREKPTDPLVLAGSEDGERAVRRAWDRTIYPIKEGR